MTETIVICFLLIHFSSVAIYSFMLYDGYKKFYYKEDEEYLKVFLFGLLPLISFVVVFIVFISYSNRTVNPNYIEMEKEANNLFVCEGCSMVSRKHQQVSAYYNGETQNYYKATQKNNDSYDFYYSELNHSKNSSVVLFFAEILNCPHCLKRTKMTLAEEKNQQAFISFAPKITLEEALSIFRETSKIDVSNLEKEFLANSEEVMNFASEQERLFREKRDSKLKDELEKLRSLQTRNERKL